MENIEEALKINGTFEPADVPLEFALAKVRNDVDTALQTILEQSQLPLFLFDYVITSVLADIRKADADTTRMTYGGPHVSQDTE